MKTTRRKFLKYSGLTLAGLTTGGAGALLTACGDNTPAPASTAVASAPATSGNLARPTFPVARGYATLDPRKLENFTNPLNLPGGQGALGVLEAGGQPFELVAKPASLELIKGKPADLLTYQVSQGGKSYINPILRVKQGDTLTANLLNNLKAETTIHWHGLHVPGRMDGHPADAVRSGTTFRYTFAVHNRGGTYWYHPHPHNLTAEQAYQGLASFLLVEDEDNRRLNQALDLKFGETDLPLVIQDKLLDSGGKLVYPTDPQTQFMGLYGDMIMANLTVNPALEVSSRIYRFRILNGSNARNYRLAFVSSKGNARLPYWLIGTDGGLLDRPYQVQEVFISPGERIEVLLDLSRFEAGDVVALKSLAFDPMHNEMSGMMGGAGSSSGMMGGHQMGGHAVPGAGVTPASQPASATGLEEGVEFNILKLAVKQKISYDRVVPQMLSTLPALNVNGAIARPVVLSQVMIQGGRMMQWLMNGKSFVMDEFPISVKKNSREIWEFRNEAESMPHPMHIHGFSFRVVERLNSPAQLKSLATFDKGRLATDLGWKDTVLIWPGETVRLALDFTANFEGDQTYVVHCHVLEHEDNGMMLNYKVTA